MQLRLGVPYQCVPPADSVSSNGGSPPVSLVVINKATDGNGQWQVCTSTYFLELVEGSKFAAWAPESEVGASVLAE